MADMNITSINVYTMYIHFIYGYNRKTVDIFEVLRYNSECGGVYYDFQENVCRKNNEIY